MYKIFFIVKYSLFKHSSFKRKTKYIEVYNYYNQKVNIDVQRNCKIKVKGDYKIVPI